MTVATVIYCHFTVIRFHPTVIYFHPTVIYFQLRRPRIHAESYSLRNRPPTAPARRQSSSFSIRRWRGWLAAARRVRPRGTTQDSGLVNVIHRHGGPRYEPERWRSSP